MNRTRPHLRPILSAWPALGLLVGALAACPSRAHAQPVRLASPAQIVTAQLETDANGRLHWSLQRRGAKLIEPSPLGITVGDVDLGAGVRLGEPSLRLVLESYPWRGGKRMATNHCQAVHLPVRHHASGTDWVLEARLFDDGFAYRYRVPGTGSRPVTREASSWTLPDGAQAWYQTDTRNYEGVYERRAPADIPVRVTTDRGTRPVFLGPPVTVELPGAGFLLITEANLFGYSGMTLRPTGTLRLEAAFEDDPQGFTIAGEIVSPWRVTLAVDDLNALVNSDLVPNLCEPPDPKLFPAGMNTDWIRPGRALITWCVFGNDGAQWHLQKWFVDQCAALDCEYLLVDAGWRTERWGWLANGGDVWARLKELCAYAAERRVGIVVWHSFPEGRDDGPGLTRPEARRELFGRCRDAGVQGVKIDFFDSERKDIIEAYEHLLRLAAEHRLTINFHGANKPTGEVRTWPNEVTREGIREQEYLLWDKLPLPHYAALPFTRMAVGHSDFLPTYVRTKYLKNTSAVFQMATAIIATTSFLCWPDHPEDYRASVFLGLVQALPLVWDETRVLTGSTIGQCVGFARRAGEEWYVGVINGSDKTKPWVTRLDFLGSGPYLATLYRDAEPRPSGVAVEVGRELTAADSLELELPSGGGYVAWIKRKP